VGLSDYGKPGNYFERQVDRWIRQYRASQTDDIAVIEKLIDYLPRTVPPQTRTSIVHGDYRLDNVIFRHGTAEVLGVLDWELSTLGDPLADFTYFAMGWVQTYEGRAGLGGLDLAALGIPSMDEIVARYCAATERDSVPQLDWYFAYNLFRITGILQGVKKRALEGNASSEKAQQVAERIEPLASRAWHFAQQAGA
jgi:aminoglycoside phosphotransferase (APT) family kinase protein